MRYMLEVYENNGWHLYSDRSTEEEARRDFEEAMNLGRYSGLEFNYRLTRYEVLKL